MSSKTKKEKINVNTKWGKSRIKLTTLLNTLSTFLIAILYLLISSFISNFEVHENFKTNNNHYFQITVKESSVIYSIIVVFLICIVSSLTIKLSFDAATKEERPLRQTLINQIINIGPVHRTKQNTGKIIESATNGVEKAMLYKNTFVSSMISAVIVPVLIVLLIGFTIDWRIAFYIGLTLPAIPLVIEIFRLTLKKVSKNSTDARKELTANYLDAIQGIKTLRILRNAKEVETKLAASGEKNRLNIMKLLAGNQLILFVIDSVFSILMITIPSILALKSYENNTITFSETISIILLSTLLLKPLEQIGQFFYVGMGGIASIGFIKKLLKTKTMAGVKSIEEINPKNKNEINIKNLSYSIDDRQIFNNANLSIKEPKHVVIKGVSGAGKSTLINMIRGLIKPDEGVITIQEKIVTNPFKISHKISTVNQQTWLFSGTISYNLLLAKSNASDKEMWNALKFAYLDSDVKKMPQKLNTEVGENGVSLSGGQAQRLAVARAYLADTPIILFDEPTSHVDLESESYLINSIKNLSKEKTILTMTHSKNLIAEADELFEIKNNKIIKVKQAN